MFISKDFPKRSVSGISMEYHKYVNLMYFLPVDAHTQPLMLHDSQESPVSIFDLWSRHEQIPSDSSIKALWICHIPSAAPATYIIKSDRLKNLIMLAIRRREREPRTRDEINKEERAKQTYRGRITWLIATRSASGFWLLWARWHICLMASA